MGLLTLLEVLPVTRTVQFPASTTNADESQNYGNWQVLISMLDQSGVPDKRLEGNLILVHHDLATMERFDGLKQMHTIEHSAKDHLNFVLFVPGLFHIKMAAAGAFWQAHV